MPAPSPTVRRPVPSGLPFGGDLPRPAGPGPVSRALGRYAVVVVVATVLLIQAGGMVTSTGSGLAYLDWPTANGSWWPPEMREWSPGLFEHGHRTIGAVIGLLVLVLFGWTAWVDRRPLARWWAAAALVLVVVQGLLGGVTVLLGIPWLTSAGHGVLAQVTLCALTVVAFVLSPAWKQQVEVPAQRVHTARRLATTSLLLVFVQLVIGAVARHTNLHHAVWTHVSLALFVAGSILITSFYCGSRFELAPGFRGLTRWLNGVLAAQVVLGFATFAVRGGGKDTATVEQVGRALIITGHVVVGAVMFLLATLLLARVVRTLIPVPAPRP